MPRAPAIWAARVRAKSRRRQNAAMDLRYKRLHPAVRVFPGKPVCSETSLTTAMPAWREAPRAEPPVDRISTLAVGQRTRKRHQARPCRTRRSRHGGLAGSWSRLSTGGVMRRGIRPGLSRRVGRARPVAWPANRVGTRGLQTLHEFGRMSGGGRRTCNDGLATRHEVCHFENRGQSLGRVFVHTPRTSNVRSAPTVTSS